MQLRAVPVARSCSRWPHAARAPPRRPPSPPGSREAKGRVPSAKLDLPARWCSCSWCAASGDGESVTTAGSSASAAPEVRSCSLAEPPEAAQQAPSSRRSSVSGRPSEHQRQVESRSPRRCEAIRRSSRSRASRVRRTRRPALLNPRAAKASRPRRLWARHRPRTSSGPWQRAPTATGPRSPRGPPRDTAARVPELVDNPVGRVMTAFGAQVRPWHGRDKENDHLVPPTQWRGLPRATTVTASGDSAIGGLDRCRAVVEATGHATAPIHCQSMKGSAFARRPGQYARPGRDAAGSICLHLRVRNPDPPTLTPKSHVPAALSTTTRSPARSADGTSSSSRVEARYARGARHPPDARGCDATDGWSTARHFRKNGKWRTPRKWRL